MNIKIITAPREMHNQLQKLARTSRYTKDFGSIMFSSEAAYEKGWIVVALGDNDEPLGFYCVRQKTRTPVTELYFIVVDTDLRSAGVGTKLLEHLEEHSPKERVEFHVDKENVDGLRFYERHGYKIIGEGIQGTAHRMQKEL